MNLVRKTTSHQTSRRIRLEAYLVGGVGSLALATNVEAGIVVIDLTNAGSGNEDISGLNAGLSSGATKGVPGFFLPGGYSNSLYVYNRFYGRTGVDGSDGLYFGITGGYTSPQRFSAGDTIGSGTSTNWSSSSFATLFQFGANKAPEFGENKFLAMKSQVGPDSYYGWMRVTWNPTSGDFQIHEAAYENTANVSILAGDTGAAPVPEPASGAIAALLMGGTNEAVAS